MREVRRAHRRARVLLIACTVLCTIVLVVLLAMGIVDGGRAVVIAASVASAATLALGLVVACVGGLCA